MASLVQNRNFVRQRKLSAKLKNPFSKVATSPSCKTLPAILNTKNLKKIIDKINERWYISIIVMIIGFAISYFGIQIPNEIAFNMSLAIFYVSFLFSIVFAIMRLFRKDYLKGTLQFFGTITYSVILSI